MRVVIDLPLFPFCGGLPATIFSMFIQGIGSALVITAEKQKDFTFFEIAFVLMRFDDIARFIVNANHSIM